jgi:hypothetical protein
MKKFFILFSFLLIISSCFGQGTIISSDKKPVVTPATDERTAAGGTSTIIISSDKNPKSTESAVPVNPQIPAENSKPVSNQKKQEQPETGNN